MVELLLLYSVDSDEDRSRLFFSRFFGPLTFTLLRNRWSGILIGLESIIKPVSLKSPILSTSSSHSNSIDLFHFD